MSLANVREDDKIWITAQGHELKIDEMQPLHVFYSVRKLKREGYKVPEMMLKIYKEFEETNPEYFL